MTIIPMDRDFIQTTEDFFFCIIGYCHPPDRILSYLKYIPADSGKWKMQNQSLKRVLPYYSAQAVLNTFQFLEENYPQYLYYDRYSDMVFSAIPYTSVKKYYSTKQKVKEIFELAKLDSLQNKLKSFILVLSASAEVPLNAFGVTGSILLNIHNPEFSDLDVTIHGYEHSLKIKKFMEKAFEAGHSDITRLERNELDRWTKDKAERFGISLNNANTLFIRKWNMGLFQNTRFSLHPIRNPSKIDEKFGDKTFTKQEQVEIQATVIDNSHALFLPSKYELAQIKVLKGEKVEPIKEVISYEGVFDAVAEEGETIKIRGQLELVINNRNNERYYRIVVGSKRGNSKEYIIKI